MGTSLNGQTVASTYDALLKVTDNGPVGGSLKTVTDGLGNDSALQISTAGIKSTGTLETTGASTLGGNVTVSGYGSFSNNIILGGSTPASASAAGTAGTITWDSSYIYVCISTNAWKRVAIATW